MRSATPFTFIDQFLGLTQWFTLSEDRPDKVGWYYTRDAQNPDRYQPQRSWWDGDYFSYPVLPDDTPGEIEIKCASHRLLAPARLQWCGLLRPHLVPYLFPLYPSARLEVVRQTVTVAEGIK